MAFGVDSMGAGHGRFGHGPCGHGPWITFPHTPWLPAGVELAYSVEPVAFEDGGEQRLSRSQERAHRIVYNWPAVDSATALAVSSWYQATIGVGHRFIAADPLINGGPQVVRIPEALSIQRGPAMTRALRLPLQVTRAVTYAEVVYTTSHVGYWRCNEATGASTLNDVVVGGGTHGRVRGGITFQASGALVGDTDRAFSTNPLSTPWVELGSMGISNAFTLELWFKQRTYADSAQVLFQTFTGSGLNFAVQVQSGLLSMRTCSAAVAVLSPFVGDGVWHYLGWAPDTGSKHKAVVDGVDVTPGAFSYTLAQLGAVRSGAIASDGRSFGFDGFMDEIAFTWGVKALGPMLTAYQLGMRP